MNPKPFLTQFSSASVKHIAYNWSAHELGCKHTKSNVGWVLRDQGQIDLFAGKARFLMQTDGTSLLKGKDLAIIQERIALAVADIQNLFFNGKHISKEIFHKDKLPIFKHEDLSFIGPATYVQNNDGSQGQLVNTISFDEAITLKSLFENTEVKTQQKQTYQVYKEIIDGF